ncbi:MAG: transglutaminase domain-containing protein [Sandaracinaceae bacterium]
MPSHRNAPRRGRRAALGDAAPTLRSGAPGASKIVRVRSFDDRIALIQRQTWKTVTDRGIRQLALQIVTQRCRTPDTVSGDGGWCIAERDRWAELVAVFSYVRAHVRYTGDAYGLDTYQTGRRTLELRAGDCDDYTILISGMALSIGHAVRFKSVEFHAQDAPGYSHIYAQGLVGREWRSLDASSSEIAGWEVLPSRVSRVRHDPPLPKERP